MTYQARAMTKPVTQSVNPFRFTLYIYPNTILHCCTRNISMDNEHAKISKKNKYVCPNNHVSLKIPIKNTEKNRFNI